MYKLRTIGGIVLVASLAACAGRSATPGDPNGPPSLDHEELLAISNAAGVTFAAGYRNVADSTAVVELELYLADELLPVLSADLLLTQTLTELLLEPLLGESYDEWAPSIQLVFLLVGSYTEMPTTGEALGEEWSEYLTWFICGVLGNPEGCIEAAEETQ